MQDSRRVSLRGTDSVDVQWSLWHPLRTPGGLWSVQWPGGPPPLPARPRPTRPKPASSLTHCPAAAVWCNGKFTIWPFDASAQVAVCAVEGVLAVVAFFPSCLLACHPYWRGCPGSTLHNKSACRLSLPSRAEAQLQLVTHQCLTLKSETLCSSMSTCPLCWKDINTSVDLQFWMQ